MQTLKKYTTYFIATLLVLAVVFALLRGAVQIVVCYGLYDLQHQIAELIHFAEEHHSQYESYPEVDYLYEQKVPKELLAYMYYNLTDTSYSISANDGLENWISFSPENGWISTRQCFGLLQ